MNVETILGINGRDVLTIPPDAFVLDASNILSSQKIGALVVSHDGETALGILSERDIVNAIGMSGAAVLSETASTA